MLLVFGVIKGKYSGATNLLYRYGILFAFVAAGFASAPYFVTQNFFILSWAGLAIIRPYTKGPVVYTALLAEMACFAYYVLGAI